MTSSPAVTDRSPGTSSSAFLSVRHMMKRYGSTQAVQDVSLDIEAGEVRALVGANGAGKSTLGKIIAGVVVADSGDVVLDGETVRLRSPKDALRRGIAIMQQEIALAPDLSVVDNVFLGTEPRPGRPGGLRRAERRRFSELLAYTGFELSPDVPVGTLRVAEQQEVAVLWALARGARVIVMDEPTSALDRGDAGRLLRTVHRLKAAGIAIVYISHFLQEILEVADTVTVMANGSHVWTRPVAEVTESDMVTGMLGRSMEATFPTLLPAPAPRDVVLRVDQVSRPGLLRDVSLDVAAGEVVGLFGLVGSGRSELAHAIAGAASFSGSIEVAGVSLQGANPQRAMECGVTLVPESRKEQGLFLGQPANPNVVVASLRGLSTGLFNRPARERAAAGAVLDRVTVRPSARDQPVVTLSGGNQQKVLLAKAILTGPKVLVLDEPTRGVDVGAKKAIYELVVDLARAGTAVLLISSEYEEVLRLSHTIHVLHRGELAATYDASRADETRLVQAALGVSTHPHHTGEGMTA